MNKLLTRFGQNVSSSLSALGDSIVLKICRNNITKLAILRELVRVKKNPEQKDKDSEREFRWLQCALTQQSLQEPILMCALGRLYSKHNVIEQLLEKDNMSEVAKHIKNIYPTNGLNCTKSTTTSGDVSMIKPKIVANTMRLGSCTNAMEDPEMKRLKTTTAWQMIQRKVSLRQKLEIGRSPVPDETLSSGVQSADNSLGGLLNNCENAFFLNAR